MNETLDGTEDYRIELTHGGLGLWIFIRLIRARELLLHLHREVFRQFTKPEPRLENLLEWSAWFGFSEPLESPISKLCWN